MNHNHLTHLIRHFNLGLKKQEPQRIYGGLLNMMWRLDTTVGPYAIKQLSKNIKLTDKNVAGNYELTEMIAAQFAGLGIPAVHAIEKDRKFLFIIDDTGYLLYPWINAKNVNKGTINKSQSLEIARILARMHNLNLDTGKEGEVRFDIYDDQHIYNLVKTAEAKALPFSNVLTEDLNVLLEVNRNYHSGVAALKNHTVIGHGDLNQTNVLWDHKNSPLLIDWESARRFNPTYEMVNLALDWSGINAKFSIELFNKMIRAYQEAGGVFDKNILEAALWAVCGNWIDWVVYNIERAANSEDLEQRKIGVAQVRESLAAIFRIKGLMPELIRL